MIFNSILISLLSSAFHAAANAADVCPHAVVIEGDISFSFGDVEKRLLCGDAPEESVKSWIDAPSLKAWAKVPPNQAEFEMKALLQGHGYLNPRFNVVKDGQTFVLHVIPGSITQISTVSIVGTTEDLHLERKRETIGAALTPERLNDLEGWIDFELRSRGYPCPRVLSQADEKTGAVVVHVATGPREKVSVIEVNDNLGLQEGVLRRDDAFQVGEWFNVKDLTLTERRLLSDDLIANTHFIGTCNADGTAHVKQFVTGAPPRTLRFGFGVDTEEILLTRLFWRHNRLDTRGSNLTFTAQGGLEHKQSVNSEVHWYYSGEPREYFRPNVTALHDREVSTETNSLIFGLPIGKTWDETNHSWVAEIGPTLRYDNVVVSVIGPSATRSLLMTGTIQSMTHEFEYDEASPRAGYRFASELDLGNDALVSTVTAQRLSFTSEMLWNYRHYDPASVVFGWRSGIYATVTDADVSNPGLATVFKNYLGGSADLRGFSLQELPSNGLGALSALFTSFETRFNSILPYKLQPFVFTDAGILGAASLSLSWPLYWSPGVGMRWDSPIGVLRATIAHGVVQSPDNSGQDRAHWQFYFSYGEEF